MPSNEVIYPPFEVGSRVVCITSHPQGGLAGVAVGTEVGTITRIDADSGVPGIRRHVRIDFPNCRMWGGTTDEIGYPGQEIQQAIKNLEEDKAFDILFSFLEDIVEDNGHKIVKKLMSKRDKNIVLKYAKKIREYKR